MAAHGAKSWFHSGLCLSWPAGWGGSGIWPWRGDGTAGCVSVVVKCIQNRSRLWGERGAGARGCQRCSTCSPSPGITITRGGCSRRLLGSSGGREFGCCCSGRAPYGAALQAEGRCQRLRQPRVPHLGTAFYFFPAAFAPAFALVCLGKPHPRDRGTPAVPPEEREAHPWARGMARGFLDRGDLGEILSVRPSPSWVSTCFWDVLARGRALLIPPA